MMEQRNEQEALFRQLHAQNGRPRAHVVIFAPKQEELDGTEIKEDCWKKRRGATEYYRREQNRLGIEVVGPVEIGPNFSLLHELSELKSRFYIERIHALVHGDKAGCVSIYGESKDANVLLDKLTPFVERDVSSEYRTSILMHCHNHTRQAHFTTEHALKDVIEYTTTPRHPKNYTIRIGVGKERQWVHTGLNRTFREEAEKRVEDKREAKAKRDAKRKAKRKAKAKRDAKRQAKAKRDAKHKTKKHKSIKPAGADEEGHRSSDSWSSEDSDSSAVSSSSTDQSNSE